MTGMTGASGFLVLAAMAMLGLAFVPAFARLKRGPTLADRVVALDYMSILAVGLIGCYSLSTGHAVFMPAAILIALVSFLGTVAFAYWVEKRS